MKKITLLLLVCFVSLITTSLAQEGIWGGKWDLNTAMNGLPSIFCSLDKHPFIVPQATFL